MTVKIKYINGTDEEITCDRMECDGSNFYFYKDDAPWIVIPYAGIESIDY